MYNGKQKTDVTLKQFNGISSNRFRRLFVLNELRPFRSPPPHEPLEQRSHY